MHFEKIYNMFCNNKDIKTFINDINFIGRGPKRNVQIPSQLSPLSTLVSFNFLKNKIVNFKIYCEIFRNFNDLEILKFLPTTEDFRNTISFWNDKLPSSLCFGIKIDRNQKTSQYYHIKLKEKLNCFPDNKYLEQSDIKYSHTGMSFEYCDNKKISEKYYFYITNEEEIIKFLSLKKLQIPVQWIEHIEFTIFNDGSIKYIIIFKYKSNKCIVGMQENGVYTGIKKQSIDFFDKKFNVMPSYFGNYDKNICSIYWSSTETPIAIGDKTIPNNTHFSLNVKNLLKSK